MKNSKRKNSPKVKANKIPKLGWGQSSKNSNSIRKVLKADEEEKELKNI